MILFIFTQFAKKSLEKKRDRENPSACRPIKPEVKDGSFTSGSRFISGAGICPPFEELGSSSVIRIELELAAIINCRERENETCTQC